MHNTHAERADQLCTRLPGENTHTHTHTHTRIIHTCKRTTTGHEKHNRHTRPLFFFSSPAALSLFSSIVVLFHNLPEHSGMWDKLMVQMTGPAIPKTVERGPKK